MKKQTQLFVVLFIMVSLLIGGTVWAGGDQDGSSSQAGGAVKWADGETLPITRANLTADLALPIAPEMYEMRVAFQTKHQNRPMEEYEQMKYIAKQTNISPIWETLDRGKWPEFEPSIFASGSNLPDVVEIHSPSLRWSYAQAGYILPLDELINDFAPDLKHLLDMRPIERKLMTYPDGKIYSIPRLNDNRFEIYAFGVIDAHLTALNMSVPQDFDDLVKLAKAIVTGDPDGDGKVNQTVFRNQSGGPTFIDHLGIFYGFMRDDWRLIDGKMKFSAATDKYKDLITEVKRWYDEGLVTQLMFDDVEAWKALGETMTIEYSRAMTGDQRSMIPHNNDVYGDPIIPYRGKCYYPDRSWTITKDADNPEYAIKWLSYITANYNGNFEWTWGVPEEDWTWKDGVLYGVWGNPPPNDEWAAQQAAIYEKRKETEAASYYDQRRAGAQFVDGQVSGANLIARNRENLAQVQDTAQLQWAFPMFTDDEQALADDWQVPADYIAEMMNKFVTGAEPLANWDVYVDQLKKFGLDSWEEAHQSAYDRFMSF